MKDLQITQVHSLLRRFTRACEYGHRALMDAEHEISATELMHTSGIVIEMIEGMMAIARLNDAIEVTELEME